MRIKLRKIRRDELVEYRYWKLPIHKYHEFNGPYFEKSTEEEIEKEIQNIKTEFEKGNENPVTQKQIITNERDELVGEVNWYWKSKETNWLEIGIVIFDEKNWKKGIGKIALNLWIEKIFDSKEEIVRLGLSTWSGNEGMIQLAEKLGMKREAEYRKARIVKGEYYDSISFGILREEWDELRVKNKKSENKI